MPITRRAFAFGLLAVTTLSACGGGIADRRATDVNTPVAAGSPELNRMIDAAARRHGVPASLVHRLVQRESGYNPAARNGPYWGLMQIHPQTARTMGYRGDPQGLLNPETNLEYAVKYLRGAYMVADGNHDRAVQWYARGYYYEAKRKGLLLETGLVS